MNAADLAKALKAHRSGHWYVARCPGHDDRNPSFSFRDGDKGGLVVKCFRDYTRAIIIAALRARGLLAENGARSRCRPATAADAKRQPTDVDTKRTEKALAIWHTSTPAEGTLVG